MSTSEAPDEPRCRFAHLLGGLLVLVLLGPVLRTLAPGWSQDVIWITIGVAMAAGAWSLALGRAGRITGLAFGAGFAACGLLADALAMPALDVLAAIGFLMFCLWGIATSLRQVLVGADVDLNRITGAVCVYVLMGVAWAVLYLLLELTVSGNFRGVSGDGVDVLWPQLTYFSFVTLTTLGYGDVSPVSHIAESLAYLEAVVGQLYIAVLIAGLVGAHLSSRER